VRCGKCKQRAHMRVSMCRECAKPHMRARALSAPRDHLGTPLASPMRASAIPPARARTRAIPYPHGGERAERGYAYACLQIDEKIRHFPIHFDPVIVIAPIGLKSPQVTPQAPQEHYEMPWRVPPPDNTPPKPQVDPRERESTILMIQWVIWKYIAPKVIMDPERMQRFAEVLALEFYDEGVRMPSNDDPEDAVIEIQADILRVVKHLPPIPVPQVRIRERTRAMAQSLFHSGWRKYAVIAAVLALIEVGTAAILVARPVVGS
jgi:hypothetical protein